MWPIDAATHFLAFLGQQQQQPLHAPAPDTGPGSAAAWRTATDRAAELVAKMTLEEKLNLTSGHAGPCQANAGAVPRLGVPAFCYNDGRE